VLRHDVERLGSDAFENVLVLFGDPPYVDAGRALDAIRPHVERWLAPEGILIWEAPVGMELVGPAGWDRFDLRRYGAACFHFWRRR